MAYCNAVFNFSTNSRPYCQEPVVTVTKRWSLWRMHKHAGDSRTPFTKYSSRFIAITSTPAVQQLWLHRKLRWNHKKNQINALLQQF